MYNRRVIRGIIFDCYGVLVRGSLEYLRDLARDSGTRQSLDDLSHAADRGYVTAEEYIQQTAVLFRRPEAEIRHIIKAAEVKDVSMLRYAVSMRTDYKVGLLSNVAAGALQRFFDDRELETMFDAVALSGETGMAKPYKEAYENVAAMLGVSTNECVMIDDGAVNVEGAKLAGMYGIMFENEHQLRADLGALLEQANA